jgi:hypothetical protein
MRTVIGRNGSDPTVRVTPVFGSPDAGLQSPVQKRLGQALKLAQTRISNLERAL